MTKNMHSMDLINKDVKNYPASGAGHEGLIFLLSLVLITLAFLGLFLSGSAEENELPYGGEEPVPAMLQYPLEGQFTGKEVTHHDEKLAAVLASGFHHRPAVELRQDLHHGNTVSWRQ